jgi:hypothetical protein
MCDQYCQVVVLSPVIAINNPLFGRGFEIWWAHAFLSQWQPLVIINNNQPTAICLNYKPQNDHYFL